MKNFFKIGIFLLLIGFLNADKCLAFNQINKDLNLAKGYSYLLSFDDQIVKYSLGNNEAAKVELISSILNNKQEIILKTVQETSTNLLVWTKDDIYNFNISIAKDSLTKNAPVINEVKNDNLTTTGTPIINNFSKNDKSFPDSIKNQMDDLSIDAPPGLLKNQTVFGFEIDTPPRT